ncbi:MAG: hypothetical protein GQ574_11985 [Crocinitomix sp.]|nr:hypothetical protein [Crocinitomix sp.]
MTAQDFLSKYLEYMTIWAPYNADSPPGKIRRKQLIALIQAFELDANPGNFLERIKGKFSSKKKDPLNDFPMGQFLYSDDLNDYREIKSKIKSFLDAHYKDIPSKYREEMHLGWLFNNLLLFRIDVHKIAYPDKGMDEGFSGALMYSHHLKRKIKDVIQFNITEIDETLCYLMDQKNQDIPISRLVSEFNYPNVDLDKTESDWLSDSDNY